MTLQPVKCIPGSSNYNNPSELPQLSQMRAPATSRPKTETVLVSISVSVASISHRAAQLSSQWKPQSHLRFIYWLAENKPESDDETKGINKEQKGQTSEFALKLMQMCGYSWIEHKKKTFLF